MDACGTDEWKVPITSFSTATLPSSSANLFLISFAALLVKVTTLHSGTGRVSR